MPVTDFAMLPPEVNSGRMYAGPGSAPLIAAASAWDGLAAELASAGSSYRDVVGELTGQSWQGPASASMVAAAEPYAQWMNATAAQAGQAASQARAAAAAYEAAFAATVPPPVIATNRSLLAMLVATNILGQNTPAIAANQAEYAEMWAQDAAAMYAYTGGAQAATVLTPFSPPPQSTNPAGESAQAAAATNAANSATNIASSAANSAAGDIPWLPPWLNQILNFDLMNVPVVSDFMAFNGTLSGFQGLVGGLGFTASGSMFTITPGVQAAITASAAATAAMGAASTAGSVTPIAESGAYGTTLISSEAATMTAAPATAGLGQAGSIGKLSVPPSWGTAAPALSPASPGIATAAPGVRLASAALPLAGGAGAAGVTPVGAAGMGGMPLLAGGLNTSRGGETGSRFGSHVKVLPELGAISSTHEDAARRGVVSSPFATSGARFSERDELLELRKTAAELAKEREVLHNEAVLLLKEAMQR